MEEGYFQFQPGNSVRFTASPEGGDIDWDGPDQVPIPSDISWSEVAIDASSSPTFFASSSIFLSDATNTMATTNTFLNQPGTGVASESVMVDLDELLSGDNPWLQVATIASSSTSFFDSPSTFPTDATTNWETPVSANACWIQPSISTTSSQGEAIDLDLMEHLLSSENAWSELAAIASSSTSFFDSPSSFPSDATANGCTPASTNTCLIQPSIPVPRTTSSEGAAVDSDHLLEQPLSLSGDNPWPELTTDASSPLSLFAPPSVFPSDAETNMVTTPLSANTHWIQTRSSIKKRFRQAPRYINGSLHQTYTGKDVLVQVWVPAKRDDGRLVVALPVFKGNNYMGVFELNTTTHEFDVDAICRALLAVYLTDTNVSIIPRSRFNTASYKDALPEVLQVLRAACVIHELPLAQTWATCGQQRKRCRRHSDENCRYCISTIDGACHVNDPRVQIFHEACSELHLLPGQGVAGKAFTTNQRCFLPDIGSSSEQEYPLSHHAKIFKLKGAMAIRLRCTRTGTADFVLEFFLPTDCEAENDQKTVLDSLGETMKLFPKHYAWLQTRRWRTNRCGK